MGGMRVFFVTDAGTFAIVMGLVLLAVPFGGLVVFLFAWAEQGANHDSIRAREKLLEDFKNGVEEHKQALLAIFVNNREELSETSVARFTEMTHPLLNKCIAYGEAKGLDRHAAVEDTIIYMSDVFRLYSEACALPSSTERHTELTLGYVRDALNLDALALDREAIELQRQNLLKGGLSNP
jgi:hypothetical protein